jgi:cysteinyl-tRNA synthetase
MEKNNKTSLLRGIRLLGAFALLASVTAFSVSCSSSGGGGDDDLGDVDFRAEMRTFVMRIAEYARAADSDFIVVPQNGQELFTDSGEASGAPMTDYLAAIDGSGRESMFYGYYNDNEITPDEDRDHLVALCALGEAHGVETLATDYCSTQPKMDNSYAWNKARNFISFAADDRNLSTIPTYPAPPRDEHTGAVTKLSEAKNFLYLINGENFLDTAAFVTAVDATRYDVIIMDLYQDDVAFTSAQIAELQTKPSGARRLVLCYLSIGEAEDYRYYWHSAWREGNPSWLEPENPDWTGNYEVRYWDKEWQSIIVGNNSSYLQKILNAGFDGVYLDIVDGFEYFEER